MLRTLRKWLGPYAWIITPGERPYESPQTEARLAAWERELRRHPEVRLRRQRVRLRWAFAGLTVMLIIIPDSVYRSFQFGEGKGQLVASLKKEFLKLR